MVTKREEKRRERKKRDLLRTGGAGAGTALMSASVLQTELNSVRVNCKCKLKWQNKIESSESQLEEAMVHNLQMGC